jgi:short-subunit dehydrogenase
MPLALILGATSDMGKAIAQQFAAHKYQLQLACRNTADIDLFVNDINIRYDVDCKSYPFDATDFASHQKFYADLPQKPDVVICVFGYMNDNETTVASQQETLKTINTNYTGAVSILNIIAADFADRKQGVIVGISSVAGERGRQSNYIYGSAKAGFTAYLSGLRNKMYASNVHVATILPGFVYTKMTEHLTLPALLTAKPQQVAVAVYNAVEKRKNIVYIKWFWKWIMLIIKSIPESMFKKKNL